MCPSASGPECLLVLVIPSFGDGMFLPWQALFLSWEEAEKLLSIKSMLSLKYWKWYRIRNLYFKRKKVSFNRYLNQGLSLQYWLCWERMGVITIILNLFFSKKINILLFLCILVFYHSYNMMFQESGDKEDQTSPPPWCVLWIWSLKAALCQLGGSVGCPVEFIFPY